jgi:hypothetical protein
VCIIDPTSPRISAYEIHEWIHEKLQEQEHSLTIIQIDGTKLHVYLKSVDELYIQDLLQWTDGRVEYRHATGETSIVTTEPAGMGLRCIRTANLPPEDPEGTLRVSLAPYRDIMSIHEETWSKAYRYTVANRIGVVIKLSKHLSSHMTIAGNKILVSYDGQPVTYGCGETGHIYQSCPKRQVGGLGTSAPSSITWAHIASKSPNNRRGSDANREEHDNRHIANDQEPVPQPI